MMKHLLHLIVFAFLFTTCADKTSEKELPQISEVYDSFYEGFLVLYPAHGNFYGVNRYFDKLPNNLTDEFRAKEISLYQTHLDKIQQYDRAKLSTSDQINYDTMVWYCKNKLGVNHDFVKYFPIDQLNSINLYIAQLASGSSVQPFATVADYKRLEDYNAWLDTALANMKEGITLGYVHPESIVKKIIPQFAAMAQGPVTEHLFYGPVKNMPESFTEDEKSAIETTYQKIIKEDIIPRYEGLQNFSKRII